MSFDGLEDWKKEREEKSWEKLKKTFHFVISPVLDGSIGKEVTISLLRESFSWMGGEENDLNPHYYKYQALARGEDNQKMYFVKIHEKVRRIKNFTLVKNLKQEIDRQRMATFTSPYLAKLYSVEEDEQYIYFIYERAKGRELKLLEEDEVWKTLEASEKEKVIFSIFYKILLGIRGYSYQEGDTPAIHRDLTPWNVFYSLEKIEGEVKVSIQIIDFGQMHIGLCSEEWKERGADNTEMMKTIPFSPQYVRYDYTDFYKIDEGKRQTDEPALDFFSATMIFIRLFEGNDYFSIEDARNGKIRREEMQLRWLDRKRIFKLCLPEYRYLLLLLDKITRVDCTMKIDEVVEEYSKFLLDYYHAEMVSQIFTHPEILLPKKKIRSEKEVLIRYEMNGGNSNGIIEQLSLQHGNGIVIDPADHEGSCFVMDSRYTEGLIHRPFYLYAWRDKMKCLALHEKAFVNGESKIGKIVSLKSGDILSFGVFSIMIKQIIAL